MGLRLLALIAVAFVTSPTLGQDPVKPYWLEVTSARRLPQSQKYRRSVLKEFGLEKRVNPNVLKSLETADQRIPEATAEFQPMYAAGYWYFGGNEAEYLGFFTVPNIDEFNKRVQFQVDRREGSKPQVTREETNTPRGTVRTDIKIISPDKVVANGVTRGWMDLYLAHEDGVASMGSSQDLSKVDLSTVLPWLPRFKGKQPFIAIDFDQIPVEKMSWLTSGLLQRASPNLGIRDGAVIEYIADQFFGKKGEAAWLKDVKELFMWADWPMEEDEKFEVQATLKCRTGSDTAKLLNHLGNNARALSFRKGAMVSGSFSFHVPDEESAFLRDLVVNSPLLQDSELAKKLKSTLETGVLEGAIAVGGEPGIPAQFALRYQGEQIEDGDIREIRDNILAPDDVTDRMGSPLEEALNLLTDAKAGARDGFYMAATSAKLLAASKSPEVSATPNRLVDIRVDLRPWLAEGRIEQTRKSMTDLEDWWDFYSFDNRFWWAFRSSRSRQTGGNRMTLDQYIQMQNRFRSGQSRLRQKQISISQHLTSDCDLSARLTLDVVPDGLQFRLVTSRDVHRFWVARQYAYAARVLVN